MRHTSVLKYCAVLKCLQNSLTSCLTFSDSCRVCTRSLCTARVMSCRAASLSLRAMRANSSCIMACCCSYLCMHTHSFIYMPVAKLDSLTAFRKPTTERQCFVLCSYACFDYDSHLNRIQEKMSPFLIYSLRLWELRFLVLIFVSISLDIYHQYIYCQIRSIINDKLIN